MRYLTLYLNVLDPFVDSVRLFEVDKINKCNSYRNKWGTYGGEVLAWWRKEGVNGEMFILSL